jgi:Domain of unknown function (DUF4276)
MMYVSWAVLYEGSTDQGYFDVIVPRLMDDIVMTYGVRHSTIPAAPSIRLRRAAIEQVATEACGARDAFHLVFIHADTGGRSLEKGVATRSSAYCDAMRELCGWPPIRCILIVPRHETEAWVLADPTAVAAALGFNGSAASIGLPADALAAAGLSDPKAVLEAAIRQVRGRRARTSTERIFPAVAQRQSLSELRRSPSFAAFESAVRSALADIGCIA